MDWIWVLISAGIGAGLAGVAARHWGRSLYHGGKVDRDAWQLWAASNDHDYLPSELTPRIRGVHEGCSFDVSASIFRRRSLGRTREIATTLLRVSHRADLPPGFLVRARTLGTWIASRLFGGRAVEVDEDLAGSFVVDSTAPERARELVSDPAVKRALLALVADLPETIVHDRALEVQLPGMVSDTGALAHYLDLLTAVARAFRALAPQMDPVSPEPRPLPTAAELPRRGESLAAALRSVRSGASSQAAMQVAQLKIRPYEYEIVVRGVEAAVTRLGRPTGGRTIRGALERSSWRVEIQFAEADNEAVEALKPGDVVTGLCHVEDARVASQVVECTAITPPIQR